MTQRCGKHWVRAVGALLLGVGSLASAHEFTPGYLGLTESATNTFEVQWKLSTTGGLQKVLSPQLPESCAAGEVHSYVVGDGEIRRWRLTCPQGLAGTRIAIAGIGSTATDVLLRIDYLDGSSLTRRLDANKDAIVVPTQAGWIDVSTSYLVLGVEHILGGVDHLLFVLALLLIVNGVKRLVFTITAFTLAHSITLGAATLGFVRVQGPPVEAVIALSILFLASELARRPVNGSTGDDDLLNRYSDDALQRVWQSTYFSWWMTSMLHTPAANDPDADFLRQMQLTQLRYVTGSRAAMETVAENYTGKSMDGIEGVLGR